MCGRYVTPRTERLRELFRIDEVGGVPEPTFNARPVFGGPDHEPHVPIVVDGRDGRRLWPARWPFTPSWSRTLAMKQPTFNAVSEMVTEKPTWRDAIRSQRAIFPAARYFETQGPGRNGTEQVRRTGVRHPR